MMTEAQALNALAREDPEAADEAKAALSWLTNGAGLQSVSQLKLQEFVWYALPVKWPMTTGELIAVTHALGRLFAMVGMERYAEVCLCGGTEKILIAYADGTRRASPPTPKQWRTPAPRRPTPGCCTGDQ